MEAYFQVFVNFEQNDLVNPLPMVEFACNDVGNASFGHTSFELNHSYRPHVSYKKDVNPRFRSKSVEELSVELKELIAVCQKNIHHAQEIQKQASDKIVKHRSYIFSNKVWLNNRYIKTK